MKQETQDSTPASFYNFFLEKKHYLVTMILTIYNRDIHWETGSGYTQLRLEVWTEDYPQYERLLKSCRDSPLSDATIDSAEIKLAARWLSDCLKEHAFCDRESKAEFSPARLLDIRGDKVILSPKSHRTSREPYCALSYCWGNFVVESALKPSLKQSKMP